MKTKTMTTTQVRRRRMTAIFNEWAKRYADDPESFGPVLNRAGKPVRDYGRYCTHYFEKIAEEMDAAGLLPKP